eukprot:scaffold396_cov252-Pinguiococcus_pyrenoidosus.AAC.3
MHHNCYGCKGIPQEPRRTVDDIPHDLGLVCAIRRAERRDSHNHLVNEHSKCPVVHGAVVPHAHDDLGAEVLRRAAHRKGLAPYALCESHVNNLRVAHGVDHDVLGLQVTICEALVVHVRESEQRCRGVEAGIPLRDAIILRCVHDREQLAPCQRSLATQHEAVRSGDGNGGLP